MKRKIAWLPLPLVLVALIFGVIWRRNHPTPTELDLEVRALMLKSATTQVSFTRDDGSHTVHRNVGKISKTELKKLINEVYLTSETDEKGSIFKVLQKRSYMNVRVWHPAGHLRDGESKKLTGDRLLFLFDVRSSKGELIDEDDIQHRNCFRLHPVTAKRWIDLLLSNPQIGPELRARMK